MEESKQTKNSVLSWITIGVALAAIILFLLVRFMIAGEKNAKIQSQDRIGNYVSAWSEMLGNEITLSLQIGDMFTTIRKDGNEFGGKKMQDFAAVLVDKMALAHILFVKDKEIICDQSGKVSSSREIGTITGLDEGIYLLGDSEGYCGESCVVTVSSTGQPGEKVMVCLHINDVAKHFRISSYEDVSFLAVIDRNGVVLSVFDKYRDKDSTFVRSGNVMTSIAQGAKNDEYNLFKVKFMNGITCAIEATYQQDARTVCISPTGIDGTYLAYGVRQAMVNKQIKSLFAEVKGTVIKLGLVILIFSVFIISTLVFTTLRSKERGRALEDKADTDLLTELTNKAATERLIQEYIENNPDGRGVIFILDIDNFKKINDTMGHSFGDTLLKTLGKEIRAEFRVTDIVGRTGGDEFMVFLKDVKDDVVVEREANRINQFFHDFKAGGDYVKYSASASIGAAIFPDDAKTFKNLYIAADQALYRAKKRGKNQLVFFDETVHKI